jgi:LysM repeat protein
MEIPPAVPERETQLVVYVVKPGDNLTKIAKAHHTTLKAIRAASNLKTDRILVGQKLKIPQGSAPAGVSHTGASAGQPSGQPTR